MNVFSNQHRRYIFKISAIIIFSSVILIGLNYYSIKILTSIRAYVNGESEYSKAQKDATRYLIDFIQSSNTQSYILFQQEIAVPIGDSLARVAIQNNRSFDEISKYAIQGRNHPDDVENLIYLFKNFQDFSYFSEVSSKWTASDRDIAELDKIGAFIFNLKNKQLHTSVKEALILNVNTLNRRLTFNQQAFSNLLGKASRVIAQWLIIINVFFILLILITAGLFAKNMFGHLMDSQKLIIAQNNAKDEFMSIASHELKTPLTSMKASLQILSRISKEHPLKNEMHPFIMNSNKQVNRLTTLVKELLDVTKIQSGKLIVNKAPFLLNDLIAEVIAETTQGAQRKYIVHQLTPIYVNADATRIYQVLDNFLSNAAKYSSATGNIEISAILSESTVKVCVSDYGPGIPKSKLPFLFDRFYRIEETRQTVQGLGLGLYICSEIVKSHEGDIGAESDLGKGSTFWFSLPVLKVLNGDMAPLNRTHINFMSESET
jgi:signal transduction histidine kinase